MRQSPTRKKTAPKTAPNCVKPKTGKRADWRTKGLFSMITYLQDKVVNPYIRMRDQENFGKCISCNGPITQAGHRYPRSTHKGMCLNIQNIHGQEISCNHFKSGNLDAYDQGLLARHGQAYLDELRQMEREYKAQKNKSFERFNLILIGNTYEYLIKNKVWIFRQKEFDEMKLKLHENGATVL